MRSSLTRIAGPEEWQRDRELYLQASTRPGAKLPHAWLVDRSGRKVSTLDVTGKGMFTVLTGPSGRAWTEAADRLDLPYLQVVLTGTSGAEDPYGDWQRLREIDETGALLVRPDGYVAWRHTTAVWDVHSALALLRDALGAVLGKP